MRGFGRIAGDGKTVRWTGPRTRQRWRPKINGLAALLCLTALAPAGLIRGLPSGGQVAQLVEQRTENPRVDGSIPSLATIPPLQVVTHRLGGRRQFSPTTCF